MPSRSDEEPQRAHTDSPEEELAVAHREGDRLRERTAELEAEAVRAVEGADPSLAYAADRAATVGAAAEGWSVTVGLEPAGGEP